MTVQGGDPETRSGESENEKACRTGTHGRGLGSRCSASAGRRVWSGTETRRLLRADPAENRVEVKLAGARNERESFQILFRSDVPAWIAWQYGIRGLLYWGGMSFSRQVDDPWTDPKTLDRRDRGKDLLYNGGGSPAAYKEARALLGARIVTREGEP